MKDSEFRNWVNNLYFENCKEREAFGDSPCKDTQEYFNKFKYWLKREFKHQRSK